MHATGSRAAEAMGASAADRLRELDSTALPAIHPPASVRDPGVATACGDDPE